MVGYILCALLVTAGLFVLTDVRPRDVTEGLRRPFEKDVGRKRRIRQITGSMPSLRQRLMEEAVAMLDASGMGEQVATYRNMAALMAVAGFLTGLAMENILASVVLAIGLAMVPMTIIRLRAADYTRMVNEKLEMAMGSVTSSYVATGDLLTAVERVLTMLPAPVNDIFGRFVVDVQYLDGNIVRAIQRMREASENWYWKEWCGAPGRRIAQPHALRHCGALLGNAPDTAGSGYHAAQAHVGLRIDGHAGAGQHPPDGADDPGLV